MMTGLNITTHNTRSNRVYLNFYGFSEPPFPITPDPEFLFESNTHRNVIDKILYGIENRLGFIMLIGEVGTGKTTICRSILDRLEKRAETVLIINPAVSGKELVSNIIDDLQISRPADLSKKDLFDNLNRFLLSSYKARPVVIIIDDAQAMPYDALENLRLLSNLETDKEKLLQIVLVGQPELAEHISCTELRQLKQRISINCQLENLAKKEIQGYILQRLFIAGDKGRIRLTREAIKLIYKLSYGIPRLINKICDYALTAGYITNSFTIQRRHVKMAQKELGNIDNRNIFFIPPLVEPSSNSSIKPAPVLLLSLFILLLGIFSWKHLSGTTGLGRTDNASIISYNPENLTLKAKKSVEPSGNLIFPKAFFKEYRHPAEYVLQLGSFKTKERLITAVSYYQNKGIEVHWTRVDTGAKGIWYRLVTGRFKTKKEAVRFKKGLGLNGSIVKSLPWTVSASNFDFLAKIDEIRSKLDEHEYDIIINKGNDGKYSIFTGTFITRKGALNAAKGLNDLGLLAKAVTK